ncbi:MAG TPA: dTDP-4-dehydrorhamnose 3,5-epimerase [Dongiaceae bacterium]
MRIERAALPGIHVIDVDRQQDARGYFVRTFCRDIFRDAGLVHDFPQWSASFNRKSGTVRGLHFQKPPHAETKLVRVTRGAIFDVVLDVRPEAPTYGQWMSIELSAENGRHVYIPEGFAHGFQTLLDDTEIEYAISVPYAPGSGAGYRSNDPAFGIGWPLPVSAISERDASWPDFPEH